MSQARTRRGACEAAGRVRCSFVTMPDGAKDFNYVLLQHGAPGIHHCLQQARQYPDVGGCMRSRLP